MEKIVGMVNRGPDPGKDEATLPPTPGSGTVQSTINLGVIIPAVLITVFLLAVGMCLLWHAWYDRLRHRSAIFKLPPSGMVASSTGSSFCRSSQSSLSWEDWTRDEWRASTRSTTPLRVAQGPVAITNPAARDYRPRLGKISESPEDRMAEYRRKLDTHLCDTDDSIFSILSHIHFDIPPPVASHVHMPYGQSTYMGDVCHSYPSLLVPSKPPFYNLTWLSPDKSQRTAYSDPNIQEVTALRALRNVLPPSDPSSTQSSYMEQSWTKSPYHPNYNTPTNGSSTESNVYLPPGAILNRTRSLPDSTSGPSQPVSVVDFPASLMQAEPREAVYENHLGVSGGSGQGCFMGQSCKSIYALMEMESTGGSAHTSGTPMINASAALSLPSDTMASWRIHQDTSATQTRDNLDNANNAQSDSVGPSSNASMCAHLGSTDNSLCHTSTHLSGNASLHQGAMSNSTEGTPGTAWISANTSTCAQMDSCESSECSGTNLAHHIRDRSNSVYLTVPSHSTSIMGTAAFSDNGTLSLVPGTSNSLHLTDIHGLSAIPPVASCLSTTDTSSPLSSSCPTSFLSASVRSAPAVMGRLGEPSPEWSLVGPQTSESPSIDRSGTSTAPTPYSDFFSGTTNTESGRLSIDIPRFPSGTPDPTRLQVVPATPALTPGSASFNNAFEWDTFPFYTPPVYGVPHVSLPAAEPRPTPAPLRRWKQPVLSDMRYWV